MPRMLQVMAHSLTGSPVDTAIRVSGSNMMWTRAFTSRMSACSGWVHYPTLFGRACRPCHNSDRGCPVCIDMYYLATVLLRRPLLLRFALNSLEFCTRLRWCPLWWLL